MSTTGGPTKVMLSRRRVGSFPLIFFDEQVLKDSKVESAKGEYIRARGVVISGGALGTNELLARCKLQGDLPKLSDRLGYLIRTNSEAILGVMVPKGRAEAVSKRVAITSTVNGVES